MKKKIRDKKREEMRKKTLRKKKKIESKKRLICFDLITTTIQKILF